VVGTAGTADEGRRLVEELAPDVALVDIRLGDDDGIDLTRRLLEDDPQRRIMLSTGSSDEELLFSGLDSGAQGSARRVLAAETIKTHIRNAMTKLEAHTRVHAFAIALRAGLISPPDDAGIGSRA